LVQTAGVVGETSREGRLLVPIIECRMKLLEKRLHGICPPVRLFLFSLEEYT
jgi:hypothetical protein